MDQMKTIMAEQKAKKAADAKSKIENQKPDKSP